MSNEITFEQAQAAANKINEYRKAGVNLKQWKYSDETYDLDGILQNWRKPDWKDRSKDRDDFREEFEFIHEIARWNWHSEEYSAGLL